MLTVEGRSSGIEIRAIAIFNLYAFTDNLEVVRVHVPVHNCQCNSKWIATEEEVSVYIQG